MLTITQFDLGQSRTVAAALGALLLALILSTLNTWRRLRHIPGPTLSWLGSSWLIRNAVTGATSPYSKDLARYGSLVRMGPNAVATDDPEVVRRLSRSPYRKDPWYTGFRLDNGKDNLLSTLNATLHDRIKAKTAYAMAGKDGVDLESAIDAQIGRLLGTIRSKHLATEERHRIVDFAPLVRFYTADAFTCLLVGKEFGFIGADDLYDVARLNDQVMALMSLLSDLAWLRTVMQSRFLLFLQPRATDEIGVGKIQGFVEAPNFMRSRLIILAVSQDKSWKSVSRRAKLKTRTYWYEFQPTYLPAYSSSPNVHESNHFRDLSCVMASTWKSATGSASCFFSLAEIPPHLLCGEY